MRKVKLQPTKPSAKPEEKSMKVSPDTSNYKPKGSAFPSNFKPSSDIKDIIKKAAKKGGL